MANEGAWIFLSHSHRDFDRVRNLRNELEQQGHRPLMFFLKCLNDHSEVDGLIEREIKAREWFLLCESTNSRASPWVTREVEIIKAVEGRVYETVDLESPLADQIHIANRLSKRASIFLSYSRSDREIALQIRGVFQRHDYGVFSDLEDLRPGDDWQRVISEQIDEAERRGFVLLLLSPASLRSPWCRWEVQHAIEATRRFGRAYGVVPVIVRDPEVVFRDWESLAQTQCFDLTEGHFEDRVEVLIALLKTQTMR
jgi:hypothetical protein